jgi:uncharacterized protein YutE (UPF0331/DUF86 family)
MNSHAKMVGVDNIENRKDKNASRPGRLVYGLAACMAVFAILHGVAPNRLLLDWPMVALLAMAAALCLVPFSTLLGLIEKLKYGEFEILLRDVKKLDEAVQVVQNTGESVAAEAMIEPIAEAPPLHPPSGAADSRPTTETPKPMPTEEPERRETEDDPKSFRSRALKVLAIQRASPTAALVQLSIEIEDAVLTLFTRYGGREVRKGITLLSALDYLQRKKVITSGLADTVRDFWRVRNRIVHSPTTGPVPEHIVASAIDSGIALLREVLLLS